MPCVFTEKKEVAKLNCLVGVAMRRAAPKRQFSFYLEYATSSVATGELRKYFLPFKIKGSIDFIFM